MLSVSPPDRQSEPTGVADNFLVRFLDTTDDQTRDVIDGLADLDRRHGNRPTPAK